MRTSRRAVRLVVGAICVIAGAVLTVRPFESLSVLIVVVSVTAIVTGAARWAAARHAASALDRAVAIGWILLGVGVVAWPSLSVRGVAIAAGVGMIIGGAEDVVAGLRARVDERIASVAKGAASVVLGLVALSWPDVTILVVAVVFGARTILFGLSELLLAVQRSDHTTARQPRGRLRRFAHATASGVALAFALLLAAISVQLHAGTPVVDAFYNPPADVPSTPGALVRAEPYTRGVPANARAWRILYTTTRDEGVAAVASALVVVPKTATGELPVIAWAHGTTGVKRPCAPSVQAAGVGGDALVGVDRILTQGWALVATDYVGLGTPGPHPYLIGQGEARSVLDAVRAAHHLDAIRLANATVVWGHSQGGHAALWTGMLAPSYAPDVHVVGVAALSPASDLPGLVDNLYALPKVGPILAAYTIASYADVYPDVKLSDYVRPTAEPVVRGFAQRCLSEPALLVSGIEAVALDLPTMFRHRPDDGPFATRLQQNIPTGPIVEAPVLIAQGATDPLILPKVQAGYARQLCETGTTVDYREYAGRDHLTVVAPDLPLLPELIDWTRARLDGRPPTDTCGRP